MKKTPWKSLTAKGIWNVTCLGKEHHLTQSFIFGLYLRLKCPSPPKKTLHVQGWYILSYSSSMKSLSLLRFHPDIYAIYNVCMSPNLYFLHQSLNVCKPSPNADVVCFLVAFLGMKRHLFCCIQTKNKEAMIGSQKNVDSFRFQEHLRTSKVPWIILKLVAGSNSQLNLISFCRNISDGFSPKKIVSWFKKCPPHRDVWNSRLVNYSHYHYCHQHQKIIKIYYHYLGVAPQTL